MDTRAVVSAFRLPFRNRATSRSRPVMPRPAPRNRKANDRSSRRIRIIDARARARAIIASNRRQSRASRCLRDEDACPTPHLPQSLLTRIDSQPRKRGNHAASVSVTSASPSSPSLTRKVPRRTRGRCSSLRDFEFLPIMLAIILDCHYPIQFSSLIVNASVHPIAQRLRIVSGNCVSVSDGHHFCVTPRNISDGRGESLGERE